MKADDQDLEEMPAEVDFSRGERGRFAGRMDSTAVVVEIDADVAKAFPSAASVNAALRSLMGETLNRVG